MTNPARQRNSGNPILQSLERTPAASVVAVRSRSLVHMRSTPITVIAMTHSFIVTEIIVMVRLEMVLLVSMSEMPAFVSMPGTVPIRPSQRVHVTSIVERAHPARVVESLFESQSYRESGRGNKFCVICSFLIDE